jgi:hypothetical protein
MAQDIVDFKGKAEKLSGAIRGASLALENAENEDQRKDYLNDLLLLSQSKSELESSYSQQQEIEKGKLQESQRESQQELEKGSYVSQQEPRAIAEYPSSFAEIYRPVVIDEKQTRSNLIDVASRAFNVDPENIDVDSGLSGKERFALAALPTDADRVEWLRGKYKEIIPIVANGNNEVFVRKGDKLVKANEYGSSWGDAAALGAGAATQVLPTTAAIGGGIAGAPSIMGSAALSTGAYAATSGLQDMAIRKWLGIDAQPMEVLTRQGVGAAISFPIDVATAGTAKFLSRRMGRPVVNELERSLSGARNILEASGYNVEVPVGAKFGEAALESQKILSSMYPASKNAQRLNKNMEQLGNIVQAWNGAGNPERVSITGMARLKQQQTTLIDEIAQKDQHAKNMLTQHFDRKLEELQIPRFDKQPLGKTLNKLLREAEDAEIKINSKNYDVFNDAMDQAGVDIPFDEAKGKILSILNETRREGFKTTDTSGIYSLIGRIDNLKQNSVLAKELRSKIQSGETKLTPEVQADLNELSKFGNSFTFQDVAALQKELASAVPAGGTTGTGDPAKNLASLVSTKFNKYVDSLAEGAGRLDEWRAVNASHASDRLLYKRTSAGAALKEALGDTKLSPSQIVDNAISDPRNTADVLRAVSLAQDAQGNSVEPMLREQLKQAYFSQIGLTSKAGVASKTIDYNPEMIDALWGPAAGKTMAKKLDDLNRAFQVQRLDVDNLTSGDISMLSSAIGEDQTKNVISTIAQKKAAEEELASFADNKIIGLAIAKKWDNLTNGELASSAISKNVSFGNVSKIWSSMPLEEQKAFSKDFMYELLGSYSATGKPLAKAPFITMPDAGRFLKDTGQLPGQASSQEGRDLLKKMKLVLGERTTDKFVAAQKMISASQASGQKANKDEIRAVIGAGGVSAYLAEGLGSFVQNRIMAAAFGRGALEPFLDVLARDVGSAATERAYSSMISKMLTTKSGLSEITDQMGNDPLFAEAMTKMISGIKESEADAQSEIDSKTTAK